MVVNNKGSIHGVLVSGDSGIGKTNLLLETFNKLNINNGDDYIILPNEGIIRKIFFPDMLYNYKKMKSIFGDNRQLYEQLHSLFLTQDLYKTSINFDNYFFKQFIKLLFDKKEIVVEYIATNIFNINEKNKLVLLENSKAFVYYTITGEVKCPDILEVINVYRMPIIKESIGKQYIIVKGSISDKGLYRLLYENKDGIIVFDDCDNIFKRQSARNIIKAAIDTYEKRKVSWVLSESLSDLPNHFYFSGKIIIFTNIDLDNIEHAIITRSYPVEIKTTKQEIYDSIKDSINSVYPELPLSDKHLVLAYLNGKNVKLNYRVFMTALDLYKNNPKEWVKQLNLMIEFWEK